MKRGLAKNYDLMVAFLVVSILGWQTIADLNSPDREVAFQSLSRSSGRAPSSVSPQALKVPMEALVDWQCSSGQGPAHEVSSRLVRLRLAGCGGKDIKKIIDIKNESNGSTATIFALSNSRFETDLISLNPGINKISLTYLNSKSRRVTESLELRQNPAAE